MEPTRIGALERYDRHSWLVDRELSVGRSRLRNLEVGQSQPLAGGRDRHQRMLRHREFDLAEVSFASFLTARSRGLIDDLVGVPIFPRRLFSGSQLWRPATSAIRDPAELAGKRVGIRGYQITLSVLLRGDLGRDHGVDWRTVTWCTEIDDVVAVALPPDARVEPLPAGMRVDAAATQGLVDAFAVPHPPAAVLAPDTSFARVLDDPREADERALARRGYWPIMHLLAVKRDWFEADPELGPALLELFADGRSRARSLDHDPNGTVHPWGALGAQEEARRLGTSLWVDGYRANAANVDEFVGYCVDQGLLEDPLSPEDIFHPAMLET